MSALERLAAGGAGWRVGDPAALAVLGAVVVLATAVATYGVVWRGHLLRRSFGRHAAQVAPGASASRAGARVALLGAGLLLLALAAARPQSGIRTDVVGPPTLDLAVVLDASRSMLARDVAPDRLTLARAAITALLDRLPGDRVAIVAFAGSAFVQAPLTPDRGAARLLLDAVDPATMPRQGTDVGAALDAAARALEASRRDGAARAVLLVSDGEDHGAGAADAADRLALAGVTVFTAGVGTSAGAAVPRDDADGFVVQGGRAVVSRLEEARLADLAARGGGRYVHVGDDDAVGELWHALRRARRETSQRTRISAWDERIEPFAVAGLLLILAAVVPLPRRASTGPARARSVIALFALALAGVSPFLTEHEGLASANALAASDPAAALPLFDDVERELGPHAEIDVDRGLALFRAGRLGEARRSFALSARSRGPLASRGAYADGVAASSTGDEDGAITAWRRALVLDPANGSARFDLEVLLRRRAERRAHPPATPGDAGQPASRRGDERNSQEGAGPERPSREAQRLRAERAAPGRSAPMSRAEAERLLDAVAAGERVLPMAPPARREAAATQPW